MCDYSLHAIKRRDAMKYEVLMTSGFPETNTRGFASPGDTTCAVCLKPGTELAFDHNARKIGFCFNRTIKSKLARFRQVDLHNQNVHHDALEFDNGQIVKLNDLVPGQCVRVVQMPPSKFVRKPQQEQAPVDDEVVEQLTRALG